MFKWLMKLFSGRLKLGKSSVTANENIPSPYVSLSLKEQKKIPGSTPDSFIEYLRLKSNKTKIKHESFNLNNVLNELSGSLSRDFLDSGVELIFDIDKQVSKNLIGDSLQFGKILTSLARSLIEKDTDAEIEIKISQSISLGEKQKLNILILSQGVYLSEEELRVFSVPYYDNNAKKYIKLDLYVAKEMAKLMGGTLDVKSEPKSGVSIYLTIPFLKEKNEEMRKYRLPSKDLVGKKVFLVDSSEKSALAIKKMLSYFRYKVDISSVEYFQEKKRDLSSYDIAIFDETLLTPRVVRHLKKMKEKSGLKIVLLSNIFHSGRNDKYSILSIVDAVTDKPFSQERIFEMILDLNRTERRGEHQNADKERREKSGDVAHSPIVHRALFENRANVDTSSFSIFEGNRILIVDDNRINQKILLHVLGKSGMHIDTANDGQEAVEMTLERKEEQYDLILMDINMPVMDGYRATSVIRKVYKDENLPIVALTTLILESEIEKMFAHGVNGYLHKPLEVGRLYDAFVFFLDKHDKATRDEQIVLGAQKEFDGLDVEQGIRNAGGDTVMYIEILREFFAAYGDSPQLMRSLVDSRNYDQVKLLCADMKSMAHTIGAYGVYAVSDQISKHLLYDNAQKVPQHIEPYRREFEKLNQAILAYTQGGES